MGEAQKNHNDMVWQEMHSCVWCACILHQHIIQHAGSRDVNEHRLRLLLCTATLYNACFPITHINGCRIMEWSSVLDEKGSEAEPDVIKKMKVSCQPA